MQRNGDYTVYENGKKVTQHNPHIIPSPIEHEEKKPDLTYIQSIRNVFTEEMKKTTLYGTKSE